MGFCMVKPLKFTPKECELLTGMSLDALIKYCYAEIKIDRVGANSEFILSQIARHLDVPPEAAALRPLDL